MTRMIGISGKSGSNKLFYAFRIMRELRVRGQKTVWLNFAELLYDEFNQIADLYLSGVSQDELIDRFNLHGVPTWELFELLSQDLGEKHPDYGYSRRVEAVWRGMVVLGHGIRRKQDPDYFVKKIQERFGDASFAVSTDLRFPNEADWIRLNGGINLRLELVDSEDRYGGYKYNEGMNDPTETALDDYPFFDYHFVREIFNGQEFGRELEDFFELPRFEEKIR